MASRKDKRDQEHEARVRERAEIDRLRGDDEPSRAHASPFSINSIRSGTFNSLMVKIVMGLLVFIFAVGFALTSLAPQNDGDGSGPAPTGPVAKVGDQTIERDIFEAAAGQQAEQMSQFGMNVGPAELLGLRLRSLQQLTDHAALLEDAKASGITASQAEIDKKIDEFIDEQIKAQKAGGEADFRRQVESKFGSMDDYRKQMRENIKPDAVRDQVLLDKLEKKIKDDNKAGEAQYKRNQTKLNLRQIVIRPKLPAPTAKDPKAEAEKNEAEAKTRAEKLATQLKANATLQNFVQTAKTASDDIATKIKGGQIGWKLPVEMTFPDDVKKALVDSNDKLVGPLQDSASKDWYLFFIEGRAEKLPADYAKNKKTLLKKFEDEEDNKAWTQYQQDAAKKHDVQIEDPALLAFKIQSEGVMKAPPDQQDALKKQALEGYEEASKGLQGPEAAAVHYQMAQLYRDLKQPDKAIASLRAANKDSAQPSQVDLELVRALRETGKKDEAIKNLGEMSKKIDEAPPSQSPFGDPNAMLRGQMAVEYEALDKKELALKERAKIQQPGGMGGLGGMNGGPITINPSGR